MSVFIGEKKRWWINIDMYGRIVINASINEDSVKIVLPYCSKETYKELAVMFRKEAQKPPIMMA